jgi:NarL family two-component system response regulator YdfI
MAEPARALMASESVRVALRIADAARAHELATMLRDRGYFIAQSLDADVTISDAGSNELHAVAEEGPGARAILPADATPRQIDAAVRAVAAGLNVQTPQAGKFSSLEEHEAPSPLTPRELEILIALSDGLSNKAIARRFDISQHTVKFHAESIFRKLGASTRAEAVARGLRHGLVHL